MELLYTNIVNLSHNEENIEVKVETATLKFLASVMALLFKLMVSLALQIVA